MRDQAGDIILSTHTFQDTSHLVYWHQVRSGSLLFSIGNIAT